MEHPTRKPMRLKEYDYGTNGAYFITVCTEGKRKILSDIFVGQGLAPAEIRLTPYGEIAERQILDLENRYPCIRIDKYVIMPNHIHMIVMIQNETAGASPCPTIADVMCAYKSLTTRMCNKRRYIGKLFQTSYHDHIIRGERDYAEIWQYIENNPLKWTLDEYYQT